MLKTAIVYGHEKRTHRYIETAFNVSHHKIKDIVAEMKTVDCLLVSYAKFWNEQNGKQRKIYLYFKKHLIPDIAV